LKSVVHLVIIVIIYIASEYCLPCPEHDNVLTAMYGK
jgi:hypothetical protein